MTEPTFQPKLKKLRLSDITPAAYNPREIIEQAFRGLGESLKHLGLLEVPVVNVSEGKLRCISGHQRIKRLIEDGYSYVDCIVVEFDETEERLANLTMNNPATQGKWDPSKALPPIESIIAKLPKPEMMGFDRLQESILKLLPRDKKLHHRAKDATPTPPPEPKSVKDTIYKLGAHRLLCGDIFDPGAALDLFDKKRAHVCITDPPYNVDYENYYWEGIENDKMDKDSWAMFLTVTCKVILSVTKHASYIFCATKFLPDMYESWVLNHGVVHRWLVWAKDAWNLSQADYMHQLDFILYGGRGGVPLSPPNKITTNVLEFPKPQVNELHPCQKPVELIAALIEDATKHGQIIFDPFGGSGTTLVAAEELDRVCFMAEVNCSHVDTIRKRWAEQVHGADCSWEDLTPVLCAR